MRKSMRKSKFHKDKDIQIEGAVFRSLKNGDQKEEILLESFYAGQSEMKRSNTMKIQVKLETPDRLKTVNDESNLKMNLASQGGVSDSRKESSIDQVRGRAIYCFKQPKDESNFEGCIDKLLLMF
ncbi:uncharacterized protein LOC135587553 [Musa acuminata AAA Group]|uniref:uncharacterized protein LOC135587553 n=1 Tax=Musa acuminata AAA Group TaxID=214697 RepID=UPI0031D1BBA7